MYRPGKVAYHAILPPSQIAHTQIVMLQESRGGRYQSLFLVVMGFNKYYYCIIRLQSHQNFKKHYSLFCLTKHLKKKKLSLENFLCIFLQMKTFVKNSSRKSSDKSKKKFFCTLVPIIIRKLMENLKKANVRQRRVNTVHLLRTSPTI